MRLHKDEGENAAAINRVGRGGARGCEFSFPALLYTAEKDGKLNAKCKLQANLKIYAAHQRRAGAPERILPRFFF